MNSQGPQRPEDSPDEHPPEGGVYEWYTRGLVLLRSGSAAAALQLLSRAAEAEPESRSIREALARAQFGARRFDDAAASFRSIVADDPAEDYALFGLGLALSRMGEFRAAVEPLALAAAMRPENRDYANALRHVRATLAARD
ncbi:tetratricopeptide repeat protein [Actinomadura atramentaria]|uniref:tetratricopeptide repeat protein n=1 Tax=Actinomadura atramentaria TaxID=1990 RepID=UPI0003A36E4A|nr:tetratricopeptide repeat protein [Actinomadura atramentaria]